MIPVINHLEGYAAVDADDLADNLFFSQWFEPILGGFFTRAIRGEPPAQEAIIFEFFRWFLL